MSRSTPVVVVVAVLVLVSALALEWKPESVRSSTKRAEATGSLMAAAGLAGGIGDAAVPPRPQTAFPASASGGARVGADDLPPLKSSASRIPANRRGFDSADGSEATLRGDVVDPADATGHFESAYRAIGAPMDPDQEDLFGDGAVAIGENLDANDPDAGPAGGHDGEPARRGAPIDADSPRMQAGDIHAQPNRIGEPLDADMPAISLGAGLPAQRSSPR